MLRITVAVEGEAVIDHLLQGIQGIEERASDLRPFWPTFVTELQAIIAKAFASEGASTGAPWAPLKPATQRDRSRQGFAPAHPILERTGKLKRALTIGEGAFIATTATTMRYLVSEEVAPYFKYHQRGGLHLPRRAPVLFTDADRKTLSQSIQLFITGHGPTPPAGAVLG